MPKPLSEILKPVVGILPSNTGLHRQWVNLVCSNERTVRTNAYQTVQALGLLLRHMLPELGAGSGKDHRDVHAKPFMVALLASLIQARCILVGPSLACPHHDLLDDLLRVPNPVIQGGLKTMWDCIGALNIHPATKSRDKFCGNLCDMLAAVQRMQRDMGFNTDFLGCERELFVKALLCMVNCIVSWQSTRTLRLQCSPRLCGEC